MTARRQQTCTHCHGTVKPLPRSRATLAQTLEIHLQTCPGLYRIKQHPTKKGAKHGSD